MNRFTKIFLQLVRAREEEKIEISYLLTCGVITGIFVAFYSVTITSLFLHSADFQERDIAISFALSGILSIVAINIYRYYQKRVDYKKIVLVFYAIIFLLQSVFAFLVNFYPYHNIILLGYVFLPIVVIMNTQIFWGIFGRVFAFQDAKRLAGGIDTGQIFSMLIAFISIPFLKDIFENNSNILYIAAVFTLLNFIHAFIKLDKVKFKSDSRAKPTNKVKIDRSYILILSIFLVMSVFGASFIDASFKIVVEERFVSQDQLINFLSIFEGGIVIMSFVIQTFINDWLLDNYGIRYSILILPLVVFILTIVSILLIIIYTTDIQSSTGIFIFSFIVLTKFFIVSSRDALENPLFKIFFFPIPESIRFDIQAKIEGNINQLGVAISGILLLLIGSNVDILINNFFLFFISIVWGIMAVLSYKGYKDLLMNNLKVSKIEKQSSFYQRFHKLLVINFKNPILIKNRVKLMGILYNINSIVFIRKIQNITDFSHIDSKIQIDFFLKLIHQFPSKQNIEGLKKIMNEKKDFREKAGIIVFNWNQNHKNFQNKEIDDLYTSHDFKKRLKALSLIYTHYSQKCNVYLDSMIKDYNPVVRKNTIILVGLLKIDEYIPHLITYLNHNKFYYISMNALCEFGNKPLKPLYDLFLQYDTSRELRYKIIKIFGTIRTDKAQNYLQKTVFFPDSFVIDKVMLTLIQFEYRIMHQQHRQYIKDLIEEEASKLLWNLVSLHFLKKKITSKAEAENNLDHFTHLLDVIERETLKNTNKIFDYLTLLYKKNSVYLIRKNYFSKDEDGVGYSIELLDILIDQDLKYIVLLLNNDSTINKMKQLEYLFPTTYLSKANILLELIGRSIKLISIQVQSYALYYYLHSSFFEINATIIAQLFNNELLLSELVALKLSSSMPEKYAFYTKRLPPNRLEHFKKIISKKQFTLHQIKYILRKNYLFEFIQYTDILHLCRHTRQQQYKKGDIIIPKGEFYKMPLLIIYTGKVECRDDENQMTFCFEENEVIGYSLNTKLYEYEEIQMQSMSFFASEDTCIFEIDKSIIFESISNSTSNIKSLSQHYYDEKEVEILT